MRALGGRQPHAVFLNVEKVIPIEGADGIWYLDTGARSHMTGGRQMFTMLDETMHGTVKFGDGSLVDIRGKGSILFTCVTGDQRVLSEVYYIPSLRNNIISLGQLDEGGCKISIEGGVLTILDPERRMLAHVSRTRNRLYTLCLNLAVPTCLLSKTEDVAWRWHARFGHLHFRALRALSRKNMVIGIPNIEHVEEYCDGCAIGKQHRLSFLQATSYHTEHSLDLVHTDLCRPITPATPVGNKYFLLVVDDHSRYMWLEVLKSKDEAFKYFKKIQGSSGG